LATQFLEAAVLRASMLTNILEVQAQRQLSLLVLGATWLSQDRLSLAVTLTDGVHGRLDDLPLGMALSRAGMAVQVFGEARNRSRNHLSRLGLFSLSE
jgi:hypothetical protein